MLCPQMHGEGGNVILGSHEMMAVSDFYPQEHGRRERRQSCQDHGEVVLIPAFSPRHEYLEANWLAFVIYNITLNGKSYRLREFAPNGQSDHAT